MPIKFASGGFRDQNCSGVRHFLSFQVDVSSIQDGSAMQDLLMVACAGLACTGTCSVDMHPASLVAPLYKSILYEMSSQAAHLEMPTMSLAEVSRIHGLSRPVWWQNVQLCKRWFLLVANHYDDELKSYYVPSAVYSLRQSLGRISHVAAVQTFMTMGATQIEVMQLNGQTLIAVSNYYNGSSHHITSAIYSFGRAYRESCGPGIEPEMLLIQEFESHGARSLSHLSFSSEHALLAVAHEKGGKVALMQWDEEIQEFLIVAEHACRAPAHLVSWVAERDGYEHTGIVGGLGFGFIAVASSISDAIILRVGSGGDVRVVHTLATGPADALSLFRGHLLKDVSSTSERCLIIAVQDSHGAGSGSSDIYCSHASSEEVGVGGGKWIRHFAVGSAASGALELVDINGERILLSGQSWAQDLQVCILCFLFFPCQREKGRSTMIVHQYQRIGQLKQVKHRTSKLKIPHHKIMHTCQ